MAQAAVGQGPFEAFAADVDGQDAGLSGVLKTPAGAVHHPEEGRLYPGHALHLERWGDEGAVGQGGVGDAVGVGLVDADGVGVVERADLALGDFCCGFMHGISL